MFQHFTNYIDQCTENSWNARPTLRKSVSLVKLDAFEVYPSLRELGLDHVGDLEPCREFVHCHRVIPVTLGT